jgi:hypothetical protein
MLTRRLLLTSLALPLAAAPLAGCVTTTPGFEMYPQPLLQDQPPPPGKAIILIGADGLGGVDYVQLHHSSMPAINIQHMFASQIIAVPVAVGIRGLRFQVFTRSGQRSGYIGSAGFGYIDIRSTPIDIDRPGLYFIGTILPAQGSVVAEPLPAQLAALRSRLPKVMSELEAVNFRWP